MKKHVIITLLATAALAAIAFPAAADEQGGDTLELLASFNALSPAAGDDWDSAAGFEVQGRIWQHGRIGFALTAASDLWEAKSVVSEFSDGNSYSYTSISGDATVTSLGIALLYRSEAMFLELGLRFASIDSSVYAEAIYEEGATSDYRYEIIEIEDTTFFTARIGVELEMTEEVFLVPSIGYQVDLGKPVESFAGESIGETDLRATTFGIGIVCRL